MTYSEDTMNELKNAKQIASLKINELRKVLIERMENDEFALNQQDSAHHAVWEGLHNVETAFTDLGAVEETKVYIHHIGVDSDPNDLAMAQDESSQAMTSFLNELRDMGISSDAINALKDDIDEYIVMLKTYGAARMAIAFLNPMEDSV